MTARGAGARVEPPKNWRVMTVWRDKRRHDTETEWGEYATRAAARGQATWIVNDEQQWPGGSYLYEAVKIYEKINGTWVLHETRLIPTKEKT